MYSKARTDAEFTPLPDPLPVFPRAGESFRDPSFNPTYPPTYTRVTDPSIQPAIAFAASGDSLFNTDDTLLCLNNEGASIFVFELVPETMQTGLISFLPGGLAHSNAYFSQIDPRILYGMNPTTGHLMKIDLTDISLSNPNNNPPASLVFDFTTAGLTVPATFAGVGGGDRIFTAYFGSQDLADCVNVAAYDAATGLCSIYNTKTGMVDGVPALTPDTYFCHGAHLADPTGKWMWVTRSGQDPGGAPLYAWAVKSPLVLPIGPHNQGHVTANALGLYNNDSSLGGGFPALLFRRWVDFNTNKIVSLNLGPGPHNPKLDVHPTAKNDRTGLGKVPIFSTTNRADPDAPETVNAYENEIIAWPSTPGLVRRFGRTFNSCLPDEPFFGKNAYGAVSETGRFFAVTTDYMATLGPNRTDVIILALPE